MSFPFLKITNICHVVDESRFVIITYYLDFLLNHKLVFNVVKKKSCHRYAVVLFFYLTSVFIAFMCFHFKRLLAN